MHDLAPVLAAHTLEVVVRWALARDLALRVVPMDEFTFDVVVAVPGGVVLLFDTT
ncbi:MAG: hypothetical protein R3F59_06185 [Myxococcota bacterium]